MNYLFDNGGNGIGDIEPSMIFFDPVSTKFRIYDSELIFGKTGAFNLIEDGKKYRKPYPNPEIIFTLKFPYNGLQMLTDFLLKSDIFQLGLTLLEV